MKTLIDPERISEEIFSSLYKLLENFMLTKSNQLVEQRALVVWEYCIKRPYADAVCLHNERSRRIIERTGYFIPSNLSRRIIPDIFFPQICPEELS